MWWPLRWSRTYRGKPAPRRYRKEINAAQEQVEGFSLDAFQDAVILLVGVGGLNFLIALALVRKGIGQLAIYDADTVSLSNLTRQLFNLADIGKLKVHAAAKHLLAASLFPLLVRAHPYRFQEKFDPRSPPRKRPNIIIAGVDNNPTRLAVTRYAVAHGIPVVHVAVCRTGNALYVYVQEPGGACWACAFPEYLNDTSYPCGLPGIIDVLSVAAGHVVHAVDSIVGTRPRHWNRRDIYLDGALPDRTRTIKPNPNCSVCASSQQSSTVIAHEELV